MVKTEEQNNRILQTMPNILTLDQRKGFSMALKSSSGQTDEQTFNFFEIKTLS